MITRLLRRILNNPEGGASRLGLQQILVAVVTILLETFGTEEGPRLREARR